MGMRPLPSLLYQPGRETCMRTHTHTLSQDGEGLSRGDAAGKEGTEETVIGSLPGGPGKPPKQCCERGREEKREEGHWG